MASKISILSIIKTNIVTFIRGCLGKNMSKLNILFSFLLSSHTFFKHVKRKHVLFNFFPYLFPLSLLLFSLHLIYNQTLLKRLTIRKPTFNSYSWFTLERGMRARQCKGNVYIGFNS